MSAIYWSVTAMDLMNALDCFPADEVVKFVVENQTKGGGFAPAAGHDPHLLMTLSAIQVGRCRQHADTV